MKKYISTFIIIALTGCNYQSNFRTYPVELSPESFQEISQPAIKSQKVIGTSRTYKITEVCYAGTVYIRSETANWGGFSAKMIANPTAKPGELTQPLVEKC